MPGRRNRDTRELLCAIENNLVWIFDPAHWGCATSDSGLGRRFISLKLRRTRWKPGSHFGLATRISRLEARFLLDLRLKEPARCRSCETKQRHLSTSEFDRRLRLDYSFRDRRHSLRRICAILPSAQISTSVPSSMTQSGGMRKNSVGRVAIRTRPE